MSNSATSSQPSAVHTPGPWVVANSDDWNTVVIGEGAEICTCIPHQGGDRKANARLIAAAPDLLEALDALFSSRNLADDTRRDVLNRVLAAIAKATQP